MSEKLKEFKINITRLSQKEIEFKKLKVLKQSSRVI